jgi:hypothetical protein
MRVIWLGAVSVLLAASPATRPADHIVIRHDRPDSLYRALGERFPSVARIGRRGDGTLIAPRWILTAAHVALGADRAGITVALGGRTYAIERVVVHPDWRELGPHDIGLILLREPVAGVTPVSLYRGTDEAGRVATIVGHGDTRTGLGGPWQSDGRVRGAHSRVARAGDAHLVFAFERPPAGEDLGGAPGRGDSGGPAFLLRGDSVFVAGVSSAGFDGEAGPGTYGAVDHFTRVSRYAAWIEAAMAAR